MEDKEPTYHVEFDPAQPAWGWEGGVAPMPVILNSWGPAGTGEFMKLYAYPGSGTAPTPVPPPIPFEIQPVPEREVIRVLNDVTWQQLQLQVFVSYEELHRAPDRRAFRKLLGERLQAVYQEALAEWEKIHQESEE